MARGDVPGSGKGSSKGEAKEVFFPPVCMYHSVRSTPYRLDRHTHNREETKKLTNAHAVADPLSRSLSVWHSGPHQTGHLDGLNFRIF